MTARPNFDIAIDRVMRTVALHQVTAPIHLDRKPISCKCVPTCFAPEFDTRALSDAERSASRRRVGNVIVRKLHTRASIHEYDGRRWIIARERTPTNRTTRSSIDLQRVLRR